LNEQTSKVGFIILPKLLAQHEMSQVEY